MNKTWNRTRTLSSASRESLMRLLLTQMLSTWMHSHGNWTLNSPTYEKLSNTTRKSMAWVLHEAISLITSGDTLENMQKKVIWLTSAAAEEVIRKWRATRTNLRTEETHDSTGLEQSIVPADRADRQPNGRMQLVRGLDHLGRRVSSPVTSSLWRVEGLMWHSSMKQEVWCRTSVTSTSSRPKISMK